MYNNKATSSNTKIATNCDSGIQFATYVLGVAINANLLLNTSNCLCKFWFIFSLILSENAPNVHFREVQFQNFPGGGGIPPDLPSVLSPSFNRTNSELLPSGLNKLGKCST